jgi:hypothetical protein
MSWFRSSRERQYWSIAAGLVVLTWATLYWARPSSNWFRDRGWLTELMVLIFVVAGAAVLGAVLRMRPGWRELAVLGMFAIVYFLSVRPLMGQPEEALHFVQYGLVGGFFYAALGERRRHLRDWSPGMPHLDPVAGEGGAAPAAGRRGRSVLALPGMPAVAALALSAGAGWADEGIQFLLPNRYYDLRDVGFNAAAAALAIAGTACWRWARQRGEAGQVDLV